MKNKTIVSLLLIAASIVAGIAAYAATATRVVRTSTIVNSTNALAVCTSRGAETVALTVWNKTGTNAVYVAMSSSVDSSAAWTIAAGGSLSFPNSTIDAVPVILYGLGGVTNNLVVVEQWIR